MFDLVIVTDALIGDFVLWHDTIDAFKNKYAGKKCLLICDERLKGIATSDDFYTEIIGFNRKRIKGGIKYYLSLYLKLRKIHSEILIYPSTTRHLIGELLVFPIKAKERISLLGFVSDNSTTFKKIVRKIFAYQYTRLVENSYSNEIKEIESFTKEIVFHDYEYGHTPLRIINCPTEVPAKYALVSLSSSRNCKVWSMDRFAKVIDHIPKEYSVVLSGVGPEDVERARIIKQMVIDSARIVDMINKTTVMELVSLISKAKFVIGNDSSAVHIAAASRVPSICIFHGAHFNRFLPYPDDLPCSYFNPRAVYYKMDCFGCSYQCDKPIDGPFYCLQQVSVDMVVSELERLLNTIKVHESSESN